MAMSRSFWYRWAAVAVVAGAVAYAGVVYNRQDMMRVRLNDLLTETVEEKEQLQSTIASMESQIREKEGQLAQLQDVQSIRQQLAAAQTAVENLTKEFEKVNRERVALQESNLSLTSRFQNTTKEYMRTIEELKKAKDDIARLSREANPDKKKLDESTRIAQAKTQELAAVQADFAKQQQMYEQLVAANKGLEKKVRDLESERASLTARMQQLDVDLSNQGSPLKNMRDSIDQLKTQLARKDSQIKTLEAELAKADEAAAVRARGGDTRTAAREAPRSAEQDQKISEILVRKEIELEANRKDALAAREKVMALEAKIANLDNALSARQQTQDKVRELESERLALQSKLTDLQVSFNKKSELSQNLQQNVDYLTQQLSTRDTEKKELVSKLAGLDVNARQDLDKERARYAEINTLYNSLKTQVSQFSDTLNAKTVELEQRNRDLYALREEVTGLKSKTMILENELADAKDRQRKTLDDLIAAVRLNSILQDRIAGGASVPYANMDDKQKAEDLRRKVEVILVNPKQP
jgi:chromosome segregation ATPase